MHRVHQGLSSPPMERRGDFRHGRPLQCISRSEDSGANAPRTTINATAVWLSVMFALPARSPTQVDLAKPKFRSEVIAKLPVATAPIESLGQLAHDLDQFR
jgi:hypothetical protein